MPHPKVGAKGGGSNSTKKHCLAGHMVDMVAANVVESAMPHNYSRGVMFATASLVWWALQFCCGPNCVAAQLPGESNPPRAFTIQCVGADDASPLTAAATWVSARLL